MGSHDLGSVALTVVAKGKAWHGRDENLAAGQKALYRRARSNGAASVGKYTDEMEEASPSADDPPHRRDWRDD